MRRARDSSAILAVSVAAALGVTATAMLLAFRGDTGSRGAHAEDDPAPPPPPAGAFAQGGHPDPGSPATRAVFAEALPDYVIEVDQWSKRGNPPDDDAVRAAQRRVQQTAADAGLAADVRATLDPVLDRLRAAAAAPEPVIDKAADALSIAAIEFNDQLAAAGLGYAVDPDVITSGRRRAVLVFSFAVPRVRLYRSGDITVRVLHIERIDQLNWSYNLLGFTTPKRREALLLIAQVDERVVDRVLPLLADAPPTFFTLSDEDRRAAWYPRLAARVVQVIRDEYGSVTEPAEITRISGLLAGRIQLFTRWNALLDPRGMSLSMPDRLVLDWDYAAQLAGLIPAPELDELAQLEAALSEQRTLATFAAARDRMVAMVERHEVQHRLDHSRGAPLPMPDVLADFVGPLHDPAGDERPGAARAQAELSAYLAELARDPDTPRVGLSFLTQFLVMPEHWGSAECYAAVVIYEGLVRRMHIPGARAVVSGHEVDRARVAEVYDLLTTARADDLRAAAAALWAELFGGPLPPLALVPEQ